MTLSTLAEHRRAEDLSLLADEVESHVVPESRAEEFVMDLEGTEDDPAVIDDARWQARQLADEVAVDAEEWAGCYTDSASLAESLGDEFGDRAYDAVLDGLRGAPTVEVRDD